MGIVSRAPVCPAVACACPAQLSQRSFACRYTSNWLVHAGIKPVSQSGIDSSFNASSGGGPSAPVWVADLNKLPGGKPAKFDGLRLGSQRAIRVRACVLSHCSLRCSSPCAQQLCPCSWLQAKYPNGDPEKSGEWYIMGASQAMGGGEYTAGWDTTDTTCEQSTSLLCHSLCLSRPAFSAAVVLLTH